MPTHPPSLRDIQEALPHLRNLKFLAPSGQKSVLSAVDERTGTSIALKLVAPGPEVTARLEREIATVRRLALSYVPRIIDFFDIKIGVEVWHVVQEEWIHGKPLNEVLEHGPLSPDDTHRLTEVLLRACATFEDKNIVHRDIKPHNLILGNDGAFWVIDFGLVRDLDLKSLTDDARKWGNFTLAYAAPETLRNRKPKIDGRSDLCSIGITLYECITGKNPHVDGKSGVLEILKSVDTGRLDPIVDDRYSQDYLDFVLSLTRRLRAARPVDARAAYRSYTTELVLTP